MQAAGEPRRTRILMTADAVGGVWSYALDLIQELGAHQVNVLLAVLGPAPDAWQRGEAEAAENLQLVHRDFKLEWFQDVSNADIHLSTEWLQHLAVDFHADLVHLNGYAYAAAEWNIPTLVVAHSCVYSWWQSVCGTWPSAEYEPYRDRVVAGLKAASSVVAPTHWMLNSIGSTYDVDLADTRVISNFTQSVLLEAKKENLVFACGRFWDPAKNIQLLSRIAPELQWPVSLAGSLSGPENTCEQKSNLHLLGQLRRTEVAKHLARAGIFVHPAYYEPFGLAVLEAASARCALVLADIPPLRELWEECAIFVSPNDASGWTQCINHLCACEAERNAWAEKAFKRSRQFLPQAAVQQYICLYNRLQSQHHASSRLEMDLHEFSHQTVLPLHRF